MAGATAMNWKAIALGVVVAGLLVLMFLYRHRMGAVVQGFQSGSAARPDVDTFTMYYADWCPHCQTAKPEFQDLVSKSPMEFGGKKCRIRMIQPEQQPEEVAGKPVKGYPTFLLETTGGEIVEYKGGRSTDGYLAFLNEKLGGGAAAAGNSSAA